MKPRYLYTINKLETNVFQKVELSQQNIINIFNNSKCANKVLKMENHIFIVTAKGSSNFTHLHCHSSNLRKHCDSSGGCWFWTISGKMAIPWFFFFLGSWITLSYLSLTLSFKNTYQDLPIKYFFPWSMSALIFWWLWNSELK